MKKYLARPSTKVKYKGHFFDSRLEYDTYKILEQYFEYEDIKVHYPVRIKKASNRFPEMFLKIDFYIKSIDLYIECKGILEYDFSLKLAMLDNINPSLLNKLWLVTKDVDQVILKYCNKHDLVKVKLTNFEQFIIKERKDYGI